AGLSIHKAYSYLEIILITLIELHADKLPDRHSNLAIQFLSLVTQHLKTKRKVADYCDLMNCTSIKLNMVCKSSLGKTALILIHEELMLEIRRMILLNELSLKEVAFELNFDSQA